MRRPPAEDGEDRRGEGPPPPRGGGGGGAGAGGRGPGGRLLPSGGSGISGGPGCEERGWPLVSGRWRPPGPVAQMPGRWVLAADVLPPARQKRGFTLGFHIALSC